MVTWESPPKKRSLATNKTCLMQLVPLSLQHSMSSQDQLKSPVCLTHQLVSVLSSGNQSQAPDSRSKMCSAARNHNKITWLTNSDLTTKKQLDTGGSSLTWTHYVKSVLTEVSYLATCHGSLPWADTRWARCGIANQKRLPCPKLQLSHLIPCKG